MLLELLEAWLSNDRTAMRRAMERLRRTEILFWGLMEMVRGAPGWLSPALILGFWQGMVANPSLRSFGCFIMKSPLTKYLQIRGVPERDW